MVFFQHSASLGNNIGLFKPKERHTSLHRWPFQKHSWQGLEVSRENLLDKSTEMVYYIKSLYILLHLVLFHCNDIFQIIYYKCYIIVSYMYGIVHISFIFFLFYIKYHIWFTTYMNYKYHHHICFTQYQKLSITYRLIYLGLSLPQQQSPPGLLHF